jgi:CubicO group peptidase (beta-lactamase class C family)
MFGTLTKIDLHWQTRAAKLGRSFAISLLAVVCCASVLGTAYADGSNQPQIATIQSIIKDTMKLYHLKAAIVQVRYSGQNFYTGAIGESMTGVPATPDMHFRNGAMAFAYMGTMLLELIDEKPRKLSLDDKLSKFFPALPYADQTSLKNLANMTSGYADYVYQPEIIHGTTLHPFKQWRTDNELIQIGMSAPRMFDPGTNWGYAHTNYVILGEVLAKITGMPLADAMQKYIIDRMGLTQTKSIDTAQIPEPVLHTFSSEQRQDLGIAANIPFYADSTFWNPSWTTAHGAIQITDITDFSRSMEQIATGALLSQTSWQAQVGPNLVGFGHSDPNCAVCRENTVANNYGLGVTNLGLWTAQAKSFAGSDASVGYLTSSKLTIGVEVTYKPEAFDSTGSHTDGSNAIFKALGNALAPGTIPPTQ